MNTMKMLTGFIISSGLVLGSELQAQEVESPYSQQYQQGYDSSNEFQEMGMRVRTRRKTQQSMVQFEPVFGLSFSNFSGGDGEYSFSSGSGYSAGLNVVLGRGIVQFETGLIYAERSVKESYKSGTYYYYGNSTYSGWDITYKNKYLEIPMLARVNLMRSNDMSFYVKGGVIAAILQSSTGDLENTQNYTNSSRTYWTANGWTTNASSLASGNDTKSSFSSSDFRWAAGLGTSIKLSQKIAWTIAADYQRSINKISSSQPNGYTGTTAMSLALETYGLQTGLNISL